MKDATRAQRVTDMNDENFKGYEDESRISDTHMTEQDANRLAAAVNDAIRSTGQVEIPLDRAELPNRHGMTAIAHPRPTGETRGIIQIVDDSAWYVLVGNLEGCILTPKWYLKSDVEVIEVAHALMMLIEDSDDCVETIGCWDQAWI